MSIRAGFDRWMERLCVMLSRRGDWRDWLDVMGERIVGGAMTPTLQPAGPPDMGSNPHIALATIQEQMRTGTFRGPAPTVPNPSESGVHATTECSDAIFHGMHGAPCAFNGGNNKTCPPGTESGWFWSYTVVGIGNVYYVDCCGGPDHSRASSVKVWCGWTVEPNWCGGRGKDVYTCTLAIRESDLVQDTKGLADVKAFGTPVAVDPAAIIKLINHILDSWWITDDDVTQIEAALAKVTNPADMKKIRDAVTPNLKEMNTEAQRLRVEKALRRI